MSLPPWSFLPIGIGEQHCDCLAFVTFDLGDALAGRRLDLAMPSPRRRLTLAMPRLGDACTWRLLTQATPYVDFDPDVDFDLDFVNARIRDGT